MSEDSNVEVPQVINELYKKLFDIKLPKENIRVTIPKKLTKHDIILDILR